jgi:DNA-binding NarL/FixJ family response regulator
MKPIRIFIADDHAVVRKGIRHILGTDPSFVVAGEAGDGKELLEKMSSMAFEVLLMDVTMPATDPVELLTRIKAEHPQVSVLVHSMHSERPVAARMLKAGASGYITKASEPELLLAALRKVAAGGRYISAELAEQLAFANARGDRPPHELLSEREGQVLVRLAVGKSINEIARELRVSPKTASTYKTRLMEKLDLQSDAELVRYALEHQLVR